MTNETFKKAQYLSQSIMLAELFKNSLGRDINDFFNAIENYPKANLAAKEMISKVKDALEEDIKQFEKDFEGL